MKFFGFEKDENKYHIFPEKQDKSGIENFLESYAKYLSLDEVHSIELDRVARSSVVITLNHIQDIMMR